MEGSVHLGGEGSAAGARGNRSHYIHSGEAVLGEYCPPLPNSRWAKKLCPLGESPGTENSAAVGTKGSRPEVEVPTTLPHYTMGGKSSHLLLDVNGLGHSSVFSLLYAFPASSTEDAHGGQEVGGVRRPGCGLAARGLIKDSAPGCQ